MRPAVVLMLLPTACSEYSMSEKPEVPPGDTAAPLPQVRVEPADHDFHTLQVGESASVEVTISSVGGAPLRVGNVVYETRGGDLYLSVREGTNGAFPWDLPVGQSRVVEVTYTPTDQGGDEGTVVVRSTDPVSPEATAVQSGVAKAFEGFSTGWYVWDEGRAYETVSSAAHVVDHHGDEDLYYYEPSGAHGLVDSTDPVADFAVLREYVLRHAPTPTSVSGPFSYDADSSLATWELATFTYFLCDFYLPPEDDPSLYSISSGTVDDGIQVMVNGAILGRIELGESGAWPLSNAVAGDVNSLVIILVDDSMYDKYISDLAFYRDGVMVEG